MGRRRGLQARQAGGKWTLTPAWLSADINLAEEVIVANGMVFTYGAAEDATQVVQDRAWDEPGGARYGGGLDSSRDDGFPAAAGRSCMCSTR